MPNRPARKSMPKAKSQRREPPPPQTPETPKAPTDAQRRFRASVDAKIDRELDSIAKMGDAIDARTGPLGEAMKKIAGNETGAFKDAVDKLQPKIDYSGLFKDLTFAIDQSHESNARLSQLFDTPSVTLRAPNQEVADELQKIGTILLTTGQHVEATAISTRALVATNEAADQRLATLVGITEKAAIREGQSGDRLNRLTFVLVILTVVVALPVVPLAWKNWIVPTYELILSFSPLTYAAIAIIAFVGLWRCLR